MSMTAPLHRSLPYERALGFLEHTVQRLRAEEATRLPSLAALAAKAGVSLKTMWRAARTLADAGVIAARPRAGMHIRTPAGHRTPPAARLHEPRWKQIRRAIATAVLDGEYARGEPIPAIKELRAIHQCSHATVRRALNSLCGQGTVEQRGRRYVVCQYAPPRPSASLLVIARNSDIRRLAGMTNYSPELWRTLEQELLRVKVRMSVLSVGQAVGLEPHAEGGAEPVERIVRRTGVLGVIVLSLGLTHGELQALGTHLAEAHVPTVVLNEISTDPLPPNLLYAPWCRAYQVQANLSAAADVGNYLLSNGHGAVAFFVDSLTTPIAGARYRTLEKVFGSAGGSTRVQCHSAFQSPREHDRALEDHGLKRSVDELLKPGRAGHPRGMPSPSLLVHGAAFMAPAGVYFSRKVLEDRFRESLTDKRITAWVCASDVIALAALSYLRDQGSPVPDRVSVVAFDDTPPALSWGVTSYNFNVPATVRNMIADILSPRAGIWATDKTPIEVPGMLMLRSSSGPARRRRTASPQSA